MLLYPCLRSFFGRTVCLTPGPVGGSGRECRWTVLLWFGVKTKQEASVFRCKTHMRGRPSRVVQPQFCLDGFFLSCSKSVFWYVCRALVRKAFFFLRDRSEKALVVCAVFPRPFVLGTKKYFFLGVGREEGRGNCKHVCCLSVESGISRFVLLLK